MDERISSRCEANLKRCGFAIVKLPPEENLSEAVASHTDMLVFRHSGTLIISRKYAKEHGELINTIRSLCGMNIILSDDGHEKSYPKDAIFNCLVIGNTLFGRLDSLSESVVSYAAQAGLRCVHVNQGYPACTTLALPCGLAITSDKGMARALVAEGVETLVISESEKISLPPYKFGFIGGAAGIFGNTVYFLGNLMAHPDGKAIENSLAAHGYACVSLDPDADSLSDLGGIFLFGNEDSTTAKTGSTTSPTIPKSE